MYKETLMSVAYNVIFKGTFSTKKLNRIAVSKNHLEKDYAKAYYPQSKLIECETQEDTLKMVLSGQADSAILNTYKSNKFLKFSLYLKAICFASRPARVGSSKPSILSNS